MNEANVTLEELNGAFELVKHNTTDTYTAKEYAGFMVFCGLPPSYTPQRSATKTQKEAAILFGRAYCTRLGEIVDESNRSRGAVQGD